MHGRGLSDAQEELLVEAQDDRDRGKDRMNPYAWERPLDAVNRVSSACFFPPLHILSGLFDQFFRVSRGLDDVL